MVKKLLLLIALIYISVSNAFAGVSVISEVNETVKRTRGENFRGLYNSVLSQKVFGGMDSLFKEFKEMKGNLYFVTGDYNFLKFTVDNLAQTYKLKPKEIHARAPFRYNSAFAYKYETVKRILENNRKEKFVLIGDDEGVDQDVYAQIKEDFPGRVLEIYIHVVKNDRTPLKGVTPYYTSFDVALNEYSKGRMKQEQVEKIGNLLVKEEKFHKVFPANAYCPKEAEDIKAKKVKKFEALIGDLTKKTLDYCNS